MTLLETLPPDILELITDCLEAEEIGNLWICGSCALNRRLSEEGGLKTWRQVFRARRRTEWPLLLSKLHRLRSIIFEVEFHDVAVAPFVREPEFVLPPMLSRLTIVADFALRFWTLLLTQSPQFPHMRRLELLGGRRILESHESQTFEWCKWFPNLEHLEYWSVHRQSQQLSLATLPRTLTHLVAHLCGTVTSVDPPESNWPEHLQFLSLHLQTPPQAPPFSSVPYNAWHGQHLPASLTVLRLNYRFRSAELLPWSALPRNLLEFSFTGGPVSRSGARYKSADFAALPRTLVSLELSALEFDPELATTVRELEALPRSLTNFKCRMQHCWEATPALANALPCGLRSVKSVFEALEAEHVPLLVCPESVVRLELNLSGTRAALGRQTAPPAPFVPQLLQRFTHLKKVQITCDDHRYIAELPSSITKLVWLNKTFPELGAQSFPIAQSLSSLAPSSGHITVPYLLPRSILHLEVSLTQPKELPPNLTHLNCGWFTAGDRGLELPLTQFPSAALPHTLRTLAVALLTIAHAPTWFTDLPRGLETLKLHLGGIFEPAKLGWISLPRTLRHLEIHLSAPPQPGYRFMLRNLPPSLLSFCLYRRGDTDVKNCDVAHLPRSLVDLRIPDCSLLTRDCRRLFPPHCALFNMSNSQPSWWNEKPVSEVPIPDEPEEDVDSGLWMFGDDE